MFLPNSFSQIVSLSSPPPSEKFNLLKDMLKELMGKLSFSFKIPKRRFIFSFHLTPFPSLLSSSKVFHSKVPGETSANCENADVLNGSSKKVLQAPCKIGFYAKILFNYPVLSLACVHHFTTMKWGKYAECSKLAYTSTSSKKPVWDVNFKMAKCLSKNLKFLPFSFAMSEKKLLMNHQPWKQRHIFLMNIFSFFILMNSEFFDLIFNCLSTMRSMYI